MTCTSPFKLQGKEGKVYLLPCGYCMSCRIARNREWAARLLHEKTNHKHSAFLTLTFAPENIPAKKNEFRKEKQSDGSWVVKDANNTAWWHGSTEERAEAVINEYNTRETRIPKEVGAIPNAPFVTDTNQWVKLGLKTALKYAVKSGATKITWETGETQNARYDLSKQVDDVYTSSYGEEWVNGKYEKINDSESRLINISGDNLKAGGKGMKGFYGEPSEGKEGIVGGVAKALVKELTGKPAEIVETKVKLEECIDNENTEDDEQLGQSASSPVSGEAF